jgi:hypothetical protein
MRSQQWNLALPIAEAGVEEALAHLNYVGDGSRGANGWVLTNGVYLKERLVGSNKFVASITTDTNNPTIVSKGYVVGLDGATMLSSPRTLSVTTTNDALFTKGIVAKGVIDIKGNNIATDSFDSSDPNYSTNGRYDPAKAKDNGDIATNSSLTNSLSIGNADIKGKASTGPGGSIAFGPNGGVGSKAWIEGGNSGIQSGYSSDDMNVTFADVKIPFNGGASTPVAGNLNGTNYTYLLSSGNYQLTALSMSGNAQMVISSNCVLYVTGNVSISGNAKITIMPGATLKLYVAGSTVDIGGNGLANQNVNALSFSYYGLPSNTSLSFGGNASFTGTIYAPQADLSLGGGGSDSYDFVGAAIAGSVHMNGHFKFHYDEALAKIGPKRVFLITGWNEI